MIVLIIELINQKYLKLRNVIRLKKVLVSTYASHVKEVPTYASHVKECSIEINSNSEDGRSINQ